MSAGLDQAFRLAAGELGMATAAWLFAGETGEVEGEAGVGSLRDALGRAWPVLDAVCAAWCQGMRAPQPDAGELLPALAGVNRLVLVGHESLWLDALLAALPASMEVALLRHGLLPADWDRVLGNHGGRVAAANLSDFQRWAGPRSALLTFVYGQASGEQVFVMPDWLRVMGPDVRTQFRALLGWNILQVPLPVYPRWLVATERSAFTGLLPDSP